MASQVAAAVSEKKEDGSDVSPITMRRNDTSSLNLKNPCDKIHQLHGVFPAIVPVIRKNGTYEIPAYFNVIGYFDIIGLLNMLRTFIVISNRCHRGEVIRFVWYVFTQDHWIAVLMITLENGQNIFWVCDSLSNHNIDFVTPIVLPIQQMVTNNEKLQRSCVRNYWPEVTRRSTVLFSLELLS